MNISELEETLKKEDLLKVHMDGTVKEYVKGEVVYDNDGWNNYTDVFGIHQLEDGRFRFFITDSERGIPEQGRVVSTEEEACEMLLERIRRKESIYKESLVW